MKPRQQLFRVGSPFILRPAILLLLDKWCQRLISFFELLSDYFEVVINLLSPYFKSKLLPELSYGWYLYHLPQFDLRVSPFALYLLSHCPNLLFHLLHSLVVIWLEEPGLLNIYYCRAVVAKLAQIPVPTVSFWVEEEAFGLLRSHRLWWQGSSSSF